MKRLLLYEAPECELITFEPLQIVLQSNTESIGGGNEPDIPWLDIPSIGLF